MPTYHLASVVDDMDLGITWVIRGSDHLSNTPKHIALWRAVGKLEWSGAAAPMPLWTHLGLITSDDGKKISKRDGATSLLDYRDSSVDPDAMVNWLLRLGWGPTIDDKTTRTIDQDRAVRLFLEGGRMRASPANMDPLLLSALDRKYKGCVGEPQRRFRPLLYCLIEQSACIEIEKASCFIEDIFPRISQSSQFHRQFLVSRNA